MLKILLFLPLEHIFLNELAWKALSCALKVLSTKQEKPLHYCAAQTKLIQFKKRQERLV
jgi:hypothetical protein